MKPLKIFSLIVAIAVPLAADEMPLEQAKKAFQEKNYAQAREILIEAIKNKPANVEPYMLLGHTNIKLENWADAASAFEKAAEIDPELMTARIQLGFLYEKLKEAVKARKTWQVVLDLAKDEKTKLLAKKHLENLK